MASYLNYCFLACWTIYYCVFSVTQAMYIQEDCTTLYPPENVTVPDADNSSITVQWDHPSLTAMDDCRGSAYEIKYWRVNLNHSTLETVNVSLTLTRYQITGLDRRKYYSLKMRTTRVSTEDSSTAWSPVVTHGAVDGVPDKPRNVTCSDSTENSVTLQWEPPLNPNGHIIEYEVIYKMGGVVKSQSHMSLQAIAFDLRSNKTSITIPNLGDDTNYGVWIAAMTRLGIGPAETIEVKTSKHDVSTTALGVGLGVGVFVVLVCSVVVLNIVFRVRKVNSGEMDTSVKQRVRYGSITSHDDEISRAETPTVAFNISMNQLTLGKKLLITPNSAFVVRKGVLKCSRRQTKTTVAIKSCKSQSSDAARQKLEDESETLQIIGEHVNIVQLFGTCEHNGDFHEVLEFIPGGTLHRYLRENSSSGLLKASELLLNMGVEIACGMEYLTRRKIIHRDLDTNNILMCSNMTVKISGFGLAIRPDSKTATRPVGALTNWRSKSIESLFDGIHTIESDMWSFGVVLWELVCPGTTPYVDLPLNAMKEFLKSGSRLAKPQNWDDNIYHVMLQCWSREPTHRPSFEHLVSILSAIKDNKQFYQNFTVSDVQYSSVNMEEYDLVNSLEYKVKSK